VIASGGITSMDDLKELNAVADEGIMGAITGRAIYEGSIDLKEAQEWLDQH
jgi:phosphoribosylformimino-5-aminoimidazole carboxamide ribotide isomerase